MATPTPLSPVRDPKYYFPDGNTVILVENTLFKVHRFQLIRDQSAFEDMFSCPTVESPEKPEGECDDNPIRLEDDTVEEMRALMGYLYSLPHEAQKILRNNADVQRCCLLARIAHKYHFGTIEKWALGAIKTFWMSKDFPSGTATPQLIETTKIAFLCQHAALIEIMTASWTEIVEADFISEIALAIIVAEKYGISSVKGRAYYAMMIRGRKAWGDDGVLTIPQRLRLLSGFHDLTHLCNLLEMQEPPIIAHSACASMTSTSSSSPPVVRCKLGWIHLWRMILTDSEVRDVFLSLSPADYLGRLSYIIGNLKKFHGKMSTSTKWKMAPGCLASALTEVKAMSADCTRRLPGMFVDLK